MYAFNKATRAKQPGSAFDSLAVLGAIDLYCIVLYFIEPLPNYTMYLEVCYKI